MSFFYIMILPYILVYHPISRFMQPLNFTSQNMILSYILCIMRAYFLRDQITLG